MGYGGVRVRLTPQEQGEGKEKQRATATASILWELGISALMQRYTKKK